MLVHRFFDHNTMRLRERIFILGLLLSMRYTSCRAEASLQNDKLFPEDGCNLVRDQCKYNAYCNGLFSNVNLQSMQTSTINYYNMECGNTTNINGYIYLPIDVFFLNTYESSLFRKNEEYPMFYDNTNHQNQYASPNILVRSVDFSNNGLSDIPYINDLIKLKKLNMSYNILMIASLSNFDNLDFLQEIDFSYNRIETIEVRAEEHPYKDLKVLNLSYNSLTVVPEEILYNFVKLEKLDMSHNRITTINSMAFYGLKKMMILNLSHNRIVDLSQSLSKLNTLEELYLQENKLHIIQYNDIHTLQLLKCVDLSSNNIENIEKGVFNNKTQLNFLNLRANHLKLIEKDMFANSNNLQYVDLSQNEIAKLPIYTFKEKTISHFSISENKIEGTLTKGMFEGLKNIKKLDLSYQKITSIHDAAFLGVENVNELLLNNNQISDLHKLSFKLLTKLIRLDLSYNVISNLTISTEDLLSIEYLSLCNNRITSIEKTQLQFLNKLEFLDISGNKIINIEPNTFSLQPFLKVLLISKNHLQGSLSQNTFNGLQAIPELDLSNSFLTAISNYSFDEMVNLNSLNISHSIIQNIDYNAFINTGNLKVLDISHNQLKYLNINTTEMTKLKTLILNKNLIETLHENLFHVITELQTLDLSYNNLIHFGDNVFSALGNLEFLDLSNNPNLTVSFDIVKPLDKIITLKLSSTKVNFTFDQQQSSLLDLEMSNSGIKDLSTLKLENVVNLSKLVLSHNKISNLGNELSNLSSLHILDLSYNMIKSLQPAFLGCANLNFLNISHNTINNINYGAFHGMLKLKILDISYNLLKNLEDEKFYQMHFLEQLFVDNNEISYVTIEQFLGTSLKILSIGGNPIPCKTLIKLEHNSSYPLRITAMMTDKTSEHNYYGVSCVESNNKDDIDLKQSSNFQSNGDTKVLMEIRNVLKDLTINTVRHDDWISLSDILSKAQNNSTREEINKLITIIGSFTNLTLEKENRNIEINEGIKQETEKTNSFIERILKVIVAKNYIATPLPLENTSNGTKYLKYLKDLENNFILEKEKIVSEFDDKISALSEKIQVKTDNTNNRSPNFTEVCVALILLILVSCVAFYLYKAKLTPFSERHERSMSTRQITVDMDNSNL